MTDDEIIFPSGDVNQVLSVGGAPRVIGCPAVRRAVRRQTARLIVAHRCVRKREGGNMNDRSAGDSVGCAHDRVRPRPSALQRAAADKPCDGGVEVLEADRIEHPTTSRTVVLPLAQRVAAGVSCNGDQWDEVEHVHRRVVWGDRHRGDMAVDRE